MTFSWPEASPLDDIRKAITKGRSAAEFNNCAGSP
jgi:hypothetical protein